ncbi:MAG TPA: CPBP family intramembrane glutamic endopeptidase [Acidobacteriaceae bacterium]|nr:CPBP family intramembrane glutamic endopeptidase [Acidobacteriaceae bacterium]
MDLDSPQLPSDPATTPPPPAPAPDVTVAPKPNTLFFGRFGFRAGWSIAIFVTLVALIAILSGIFSYTATGQLKAIMAARAQAQAHPQAHSPHPAVPFQPTLVVINDGLTFLGMLGLCWFFSRAEHRHLGAYGIGASRRSDFLPGAFWGLLALSFLVLLLHSFHLLYFDARLLTGAPLFLYAVKWLFAFLLVGLSEEYMLRGYLQFTLTRGVFGLAEKISPAHARLVAFWIAAVIMSFLFGALHLGNSGENALGLGQVVFFGIIFSYTLWRTGSLWWGIGFHMAWDWAQSFLYGVPDSGNLSIGRLFQTHTAGRPLLSGGVDGPEGSLLCIPVLLLVAVVVRFTTKPGTQPPLDPDFDPA